MGRVKKMLSNKEIGKVADRYSNLYSLEVCEDFHIHYRNLRLQFDEKEWVGYCNMVIGAFNSWNRDKVMPTPDKSVPHYLIPVGNVNPVHGINPSNLRIELDDLMGECIHLHYKSMRLELSIKEFKEFAEEVNKAAKGLEQ